LVSETLRIPGGRRPGETRAPAVGQIRRLKERGLALTIPKILDLDLLAGLQFPSARQESLGCDRLVQIEILIRGSADRVNERLPIERRNDVPLPQPSLVGWSTFEHVGNYGALSVLRRGLSGIDRNAQPRPRSTKGHGPDQAIHSGHLETGAVLDFVSISIGTATPVAVILRLNRRRSHD
jgi:hypothetical protein